MGRILLATSNPHKRDEILAVFQEQATQEPEPVLMPQLITLAELGESIPEPVENQPVFESNAILKGRYYARRTKMLCMADDSGLEVDALGGEPGVYSARYSGHDGPRSEVDPANNKLVLTKLSGVPVERRIARFICAMVLCTYEIPEDPQRKRKRYDPPVDVLALVRGTVEGRIILPEEAADPKNPQLGIGENGFGYDPLFMLPDRGVTTAQLSPDEKNAISHRGNASRQMWHELKRLGLM